MNPPAPSARSASDDLAGRVVGDYHLLRRLGQGAMAEVYLAEQKSLGRRVAFKVLKPELVSDQTHVRRFEMEARAAAALVHGNIVQIYEVGQAAGVPFIAQEYVPGQNLAQVLARSGNLDVPTAVGIMRQVAVALAKAAERGIVHRDIKPENLMLSASGEVKVADFGLARITQGREQLQLTQVGLTMGSPLYMSPEQVEGKPLDPRSDIYSFGVTCYQMLAGRPPFTGDTTLSVAVQHLQNTPEPLENLRADLPPGLCRIVHKMLCKSPSSRYADGAEILRDLRALDIAGVRGDWPEELDQFHTSEMVALHNARSAATQQLSAV
ncbi:MAG: protein kinase, partial [Planctomycetales bacterium]|nr:protein kinase [Planctomycetales bacterium]NIM09459.1 protein kinase [Planctomycetales bacterium]NIN08947.1 protein kinase [Planctomycetales bacterium]NIN78062.1 protein kinase [Planctomycetales bacterium]NIO35240.1 protein kinase [Planctomycetales bacterium]